MLKINLAFKQYSKASKISPAVHAELWHPWSEEALLVEFESPNKGYGPGESRIVSEPAAPCFSGKRQGASKHFDVEKDGKRWEVKGFRKTEHKLSVGGEGNETVTYFISRIISAVNQLEQFNRTLSQLDSASAHSIIKSGFKVSSLRNFLEIIAPKVKSGAEISRGDSQQISEQFDNVAKLVKSFEHNRDSLNLGGVIVTGPQGDTVGLPPVRPDLLAELLKSAGHRVDVVGHDIAVMAILSITHEWLKVQGSFSDEWKSIKASSVLTEANAGLILTHDDYGWFLIEPQEIDSWLDFDGITRSSLRFKLNKVPRTPGKRATVNSSSPMPTSQMMFDFFKQDITSQLEFSFI